MDVTAKTKDGNEVFNSSKIYMTQIPAKGRGDKMVYGPFRKSGMLADTSLQPGKEAVETFEIKFPYEDVVKDGRKVRDIKAKEMDVTVQLWYMPVGGDHKKGVPGKDQYLLYEATKTVTVK